MKEEGGGNNTCQTCSFVAQIEDWDEARKRVKILDEHNLRKLKTGFFLQKLIDSYALTCNLIGYRKKRRSKLKDNSAFS